MRGLCRYSGFRDRLFARCLQYVLEVKLLWRCELLL